ncbi:unnamed protein product [Cunninghamella blakesleeana]
MLIIVGTFGRGSTSAPAERVFSQARSVLPFTRSRMKPETIRKMMLLKSWVNKIDDDIIKDVDIYELYIAMEIIQQPILFFCNFVLQIFLKMTSIYRPF